MNISEYQKKLENIIAELPDRVTEEGYEVEIARVQTQLIKEIALCIAGNTSELISIRAQLEALRTQLPEPNKPNNKEER